MTEKEKMLRGEMYDANYDETLIADRTRCKVLCQKYNNLPIDDFEARDKLIKDILGKTGKSLLIEPDFWCDYGWNIEVGENFYANHGLVILDGGGVTFGDNVFIALDRRRCAGHARRDDRQRCGDRRRKCRHKGHSGPQCGSRQSLQGDSQNEVKTLFIQVLFSGCL